MIKASIISNEPDKQKKVKKYNLFFNEEFVLFEITIS